jgi:hypothetical protein
VLVAFVACNLPSSPNSRLSLYLISSSPTITVVTLRPLKAVLVSSVAVATSPSIPAFIATTHRHSGLPAKGSFTLADWNS